MQVKIKIRTAEAQSAVSSVGGALNSHNYKMNLKTFLNLLQFALAYCSILTNFVECKVEYSEKDLEAMQELRDLMPDVLARDEFYQTENNLMRWLTARNMDVNSAHKMIREAVQWREVNKIATILDEDIYNFSSKVYTYHGVDKERRPIALLTPTSIDLRRLIVAGRRSAMIRMFDKMLEQGYQTLKKIPSTTLMSDGERVLQVTAILDLSGLNLRQHLCLQCIGVYAEWFLHLENYYPSALSYLIIINVNRVALPLVDLIRPFLSERTKNSTKLFGPNRKEWSEFLLSIIDADQLPYRFGGTSNFTM